MYAIRPLDYLQVISCRTRSINSTRRKAIT